MPSGKAHARDSIMLSVIVAPVALYATHDPLASVAISVGCLAGIPLSPDLDLHVRTVAESLPIVGRVWQVIWFPYERAIPHRSWLSHFPIVGTIGRLAYLATVVWLVCHVIVSPSLSWLYIAESMYASPVALYAIGGLLISDSYHSLRDTLSTKGKRKWRK